MASTLCGVIVSNVRMFASTVHAPESVYLALPNAFRAPAFGPVWLLASGLSRRNAPMLASERRAAESANLAKHAVRRAPLSRSAVRRDNGGQRQPARTLVLVTHVSASACPAALDAHRKRNFRPVTSKVSFSRRLASSPASTEAAEENVCKTVTARAAPQAPWERAPTTLAVTLATSKVGLRIAATTVASRRMSAAPVAPAAPPAAPVSASPCVAPARSARTTPHASSQPLG